MEVESVSELIEREAAIEAINANRWVAGITQSVCTTAAQAEIWRFRAGAHQCDLDDIQGLPAVNRTAEQAVIKAANAVYDSAVLIHESEGHVHIQTKADAWEALEATVNRAALANLDALRNQAPQEAK